MTLDRFVKDNSVVATLYKIPKNRVLQYEIILGVKMGPQLKRYILNYGLLMYKHIRLFGINYIQKFESDMITETLFLHKEFGNKTHNLIAVEDQGDGDYYLVDEKDRVFRFICGCNELEETGLTLNQYILERFTSISI